RTLRSLVTSFQSYCPPPVLHSFPTRRSSDLESLVRLYGRSFKSYVIYVTFVTLGLIFPGMTRFVRGDNTGRYCHPEGGVLWGWRSEEHTSELQSRENLVCRLLLEKKKPVQHV